MAEFIIRKLISHKITVYIKVVYEIQMKIYSENTRKYL